MTSPLSTALGTASYQGKGVLIEGDQQTNCILPFPLLFYRIHSSNLPVRNLISGYCSLTSLVAQMVKHLSTMRETQVQSLGWEDPLEKEVAIHSSILPGKSHGQRSLEGYRPWGHKESDKIV